MTVANDLPPCLLSFNLDVRRADATDIHDRVSAWFVPILENKDLLCYFSGHGSVLFQAYLEKQLAESSQKHQPLHTAMVSQNRSTSQVSMMRSSFFQSRGTADSDDEEEQSFGVSISRQEFNNGLHGARQCLKRLLDQTARFGDVSVLGQDRFKGVDVKEEFAIVMEYPEFKDVCNVKSAQRAISDMLALVQYSAVIQVALAAMVVLWRYL